MPERTTGEDGEEKEDATDTRDKITDLDDLGGDLNQNSSREIGSSVERSELATKIDKPLFNAGDVPQKSPGRRLGGLSAKMEADDDDWGDDELGEDLLPM